MSRPISVLFARLLECPPATGHWLLLRSCRFLAAAGLLVALAAGCTLPAADARGESMLQQQVDKLRTSPSAKAPAPARCNTTTLSLAERSGQSAQDGDETRNYLCSSAQRLRTLAGQGSAAVPAPLPQAGEQFPLATALRNPCPPDRYLYLVEEDDRLTELSRIAAVDLDWRSWAGAVHMRNPQCFDREKRLRAGCTVRVPELNGAWSGMQPAFTAFWEGGAEAVNGGPLEACLSLWRTR